MSKALLLPLFLAVLVAALWTVPAHAQAGGGARNINPVDDPLGMCTGDMSIDQCLGSGGVKTCDQLLVVDYASCLSKCTCQYKENVAKCDGQVCRDAQATDYKACQTQCMADWV
jgi:hypothetical protein